jgi:hypothetical protein
VIIFGIAPQGAGFIIAGGGLDDVQGVGTSGSAIAIGDLVGREVQGCEMWPMRIQESSPIIGGRTVRRRRNPMPTKNVGDRPVGDVDTEVGQAITNGVFTPARVVGCHLNDQAFGFWVQTRATALVGCIRGGDQSAMQAPEGVDGDQQLVLLQDLPIELLGESGQPSAIIVDEPGPSIPLGLLKATTRM